MSLFIRCVLADITPQKTINYLNQIDMKDCLPRSKPSQIVKNTNMMVDDNIEYNHIFDETVAKQSKVAILFENLWKIRSKFMKENDIQTS